MKLKLIREEFNDICTIGKLFINDEFFCYTLEDKDRGLKDSDPLPLIVAKKVFGKTAIPKGKYKVIVNESPKFKRMLPRILNTKGFTGHPMGVSFEDVAAVEVLLRQVVPPVPNYKQRDDYLGDIKISTGGAYACRYALRFAAGFGSQVAFALYASAQHE